VVALLHALKDGFTHAQSLFRDAFARCVTVAFGKLRGVMGANRCLYAAESFSPCVYSVFSAHVGRAGSFEPDDSPFPE
jgi:hypothetical protein